ncbi:class E sortase [Streptomyces sp. NPDC059175]|uniref:class E sortase n=1 Tax=unclassified Streptomyces TaxID=2593676 RepID=UPI00367379D9
MPHTVLPYGFRRGLVSWRGCPYGAAVRERIPGRKPGRVPVVVRGRRPRGGRAALARGLWVAAEVAVTCGLVLLLLVVHQMWWTNQQARRGAEGRVAALERQWRQSPAARQPGTVDGDAGATAGVVPDDPGPAQEGARQPDRRTGRTVDQAYAVLRIPRLGVAAPVAQGVGRRGVLDQGYVGHYPGTAQPGQAGNFAVAGHRNTHGEPFRYVNRLRSGDVVEVETRSGVFTYRVDQRLPRTSARDTGVIAAVPRSDVQPGHGYAAPGHYLTLTTCTPEFTSRYRLVVWGVLVSVRPRATA